MSDQAVLVVCGAAVLFSLVAIVLALWAIRMNRDVGRHADQHDEGGEQR